MSSEHPNVTTQPPTPPPLNFISILREMLRASDKVSDLIFSPGRPPQIELAGKLVAVPIAGLEKLTPAHTAGIAKLIIGNQQTALDSLEKTGSADVSFSAARTRSSCALSRCARPGSVILICPSNSKR